MKNANYFPFERNKYFYGKLLSVDDFELEQRYMNDKRRMLNQFILGNGIVVGLYVVRVDEQTISIEKGIALDSWGREIVVDTPMIKKLSMIEGFETAQKEESNYLYLCLEYDEKEIDQVHNISGNSLLAGENSDRAYNKIREGYRLFLTTQEPEGDAVCARDWYENRQKIYQEGDVIIFQTMPKYAKSGTEVPIKVIVENKGRSNVSFSYDVSLNYLSVEENNKLHISFDEILFERTGYYESTYYVRTAGAVGEEASASIDPDSVFFKLSGNQKNIKLEAKATLKIVEGDEKEAMKEDYYRSSMEKIVHSAYRQPIYLAKIDLISAMDTYIIENIKNVPFDQYVSNHFLNTARYEMIQMEKGERGNEENEGSFGENGKQKQEKQNLKIAQGVEDIYVQGGGQRGEKFFSKDIVHGLGLGKTTIILSRETKDKKVIFGSNEIFDTGVGDQKIDAELAACLDEESGSFVIGARLLNTTVGGKISVRWTAIQDIKQNAADKKEKHIFIKPNLVELQVRQTQYLEAICENMLEKAVIWSVKDNGGFIDQKGMYTAPNTPGVYEVLATSIAYPEVKASVFVVVRETKE